MDYDKGFDGFKADVWSIACVIYEILIGAPLFLTEKAHKSARLSFKKRNHVILIKNRLIDKNFLSEFDSFPIFKHILFKSLDRNPENRPSVLDLYNFIYSINPDDISKIERIFPEPEEEPFHQDQPSYKNQNHNQSSVSEICVAPLFNSFTNLSSYPQLSSSTELSVTTPQETYSVSLYNPVRTRDQSIPGSFKWSQKISMIDTMKSHSLLISYGYSSLLDSAIMPKFLADKKYMDSMVPRRKEMKSTYYHGMNDSFESQLN